MDDMNLLRVLRLAALSLTLVSPAFAGVNSWTLAGSGGGLTTAVAIHPTQPQVMLASTGNGIYRSADGGATWTRSGEARNAVAIVFNPANPSRVFAASHGGRVHRSEDGGVSFPATSAPSIEGVTQLAMASDGTLYVGDYQSHVLKSTDSGSSWTELAVPWPFDDETINAIAVDPQNPNVVFISVQNIGTYKSVNAGASWGSPIAGSPGSNGSRVHTLVVKPDDSLRVLGGASDGTYISVDGGATWALIPGSTDLRAIAFDPATPNDVIALSRLGQVERSADGGSSWPFASWGAKLRSWESNEIAISTTGRVLVAVSEGAMVSDDGGDTFSLVSGYQSEGLYSIATANDGALFAVTPFGPFGVFRRTGTSWTPLDNDELYSRIGNTPFLRIISVAPQDSERLCVVSYFDSLLCSADGGDSWSNPAPEFSNSATIINNVVIDPANADVVYAITDNFGLWKRSTPNGSFVVRSNGLPPRLRAFAVDPSNTQVLYAGGYYTPGNGVFKSTDGGVTWSPTGALPDKAVHYLRIDPENSQRIYAVLQGAFYKSENGGATWVHAGLGDPTAWVGSGDLYIDPLVPSTLIAGFTTGLPGFSRSVDRGVTWQEFLFVPAYGIASSNEAFGFDSNTGSIITGGLASGIHEYRISTDLGVTASGLERLPLAAPGALTVVTTNYGPYDAAAPQLDITVPANLAITVPDGCVFQAPNLRCTLPAILAGQAHTTAVPFTANAASSQETGSVVVHAREYDWVAGNDSLALTASVQPTAAISVTSTATATVQVNSPISYTATIRNDGPNTAATTVFSLALPAGVTVQSFTPSPGCVASAIALVCTINGLASNTSIEVTLRASTAAVGSLAWAASLSATVDNTSDNDQSTSTTVVTAADPPAGGGGGSSGGNKGGGGSFDWLVVGLLGLLIAARRHRAQ
jgi:uncharacterized repeat protein (TIGR01451 family)